MDKKTKTEIVAPTDDTPKSLEVKGLQRTPRVPRKPLGAKGWADMLAGAIAFTGGYFLAGVAVAFSSFGLGLIAVVGLALFVLVKSEMAQKAEKRGAL